MGLVVGWIVTWVRRRLDDPPTEIADLVDDGVLRLPAGVALDVSGVVAAVTVGIYLGGTRPSWSRRRPGMQTFAVWEILVFVLNALLFTLLGLQFESILDALEGYAAGDADRLRAAIVSAAVIAIRLVWVFPLTYVPRCAVPARARNARPTALAASVARGWAACAAPCRSRPRSRSRSRRMRARHSRSAT